VDRNRSLVQAYGVSRQNRLNFLPPWIESPMRYSSNFTLTVGMALSSEYIFRANSLFDPDKTGVGHSPRGFLNLAAVYQKYRVDKLEWYIEMPSITLSFSAGVALVNNDVSIGSLDALAEYPTARTHSVGFNGAPPAIFVGHKMLAPFLGHSNLNYNIDPNTGAVVTTNPSEVIDLHIVINNPNAFSPITVQVTVNLKYRAVLYDPINPVLAEIKLIKK